MCGIILHLPACVLPQAKLPLNKKCLFLIILIFKKASFYRITEQLKCSVMRFHPPTRSRRKVIKKETVYLAINWLSIFAVFLWHMKKKWIRYRRLISLCKCVVYIHIVNIEVCKCTQSTKRSLIVVYFNHI